jgi:hypothetical protein
MAAEAAAPHLHYIVAVRIKGKLDQYAGGTFARTSVHSPPYRSWTVRRLESMAQFASAPSRSPQPSRLGRILFVALAALLAVRPLLTESYERVDLPFVTADAAFGPTPAATVLLDFLTLAVAGAALAWRGWPARAIVPAVIALALAVALSTIAADSKRVALNAGATLVVFAIAGAAVVRLADSRARAALLVAAMLASVTTNAAKCMMQRGYEFDDTLQAWIEQKAARDARGETVNDSATENFERRMRSQNAFGYLAHPNVAASIMAAGAVAAFATCIASALGGSGAAAALAGTIGLLAVGGVWLTGSIGALASIFAGGAALAVAASQWPARRAFGLLTVAYAAGIFALLAYGTAKGTLPGASLAFRWEYWTAAAKALPDAGVFGLGRENFVTAHIRNKPATATEEVRNPHNVWVSLWIELGPLGFVAGAALLGVAGWVATRATSSGTPGAAPPSRLPRADAACIAAGILALHAVFSGTPFDKPGIAVLWLAEVGLIWTTAFLAALFAVASAMESGRFARIVVAGGVAAAAVMLVHNLVDFSLLTPAGLAAFVTLAVAFVGSAQDASAPAAGEPWKTRSRVAASGRVAAALLIPLAYFAAIVQPTVATTQILAQADAAFAAARSTAQVETASAIDLMAAHADNLDADTPRRAARRQFQLAHQPRVPDDIRALFLERAEQDAQLSRGRAPRSVLTKRLLARIADATATATAGDTALLVRAAKRWDDVTEAYPTSAQDHLDAGSAYFRLWQQTHEPGPSGSALDHFQAALRIDNTRPKENASKLRPDDLHRIQAALEEMQPEVFRRAESTP